MPASLFLVYVFVHCIFGSEASLVGAAKNVVVANISVWKSGLNFDPGSKWI